MALTVGELTGVIDMDAGPAKKSFGGFFGMLKKTSVKGAAVAAAAGTAVGAALAAGISGAMNVEAANDKMAAQLGLGADRAEELGQVAGDLYAGAWGDSLEEVNAAVGAVVSSIEGMADASGAQIEGVTAKALDFANAFETDVSRAAQVAGQVVSTGLAKDADEAFDLLVASSQKVPTAVREDLLDAADEYGQFFAALGFSGEQAFAALVDASEKGSFGIDKMGDALKELPILATDGSKRTQEAFKVIGVDADAMSNAILAGGGKAQTATQQIVDGLLKIKDPSQQAQTAIALFGTPLEDLNVTEIPQFLSALDKGSSSMAGFSGAADEMGNTLNDNASTNLESFKRQAHQAFVGFVGGQALPIVNSFAATVATGFGPAMSEVGRVVSSDVTPALQSLVSWLTTTDSGMMTLRSAAGLMVAAGAVIVATWVWMRVQAMAHAVRMAAAWFIAMGPVGWAIAAIIAIAAIVIANWGRIVDWTKKSWKWIREKTVGGAKNILSWVKGNWKKILGFLTGPIGIAVLMIVKNWDKIKAGARTAKDFVVRMFKALASRVRSDISRVISFVKSIPGKIKSAFSGANSWLVDAGKRIIQGLINGIKRMAGKAKDAAKDVTRKIKNMLPGSPVKEGPLTVLNRGYAGGEIVRMLADGMTREAGLLDGAMASTVGTITLPTMSAPQRRDGDVNVAVGFSRRDLEGIAEVVVQRGEKKTQRLVRMGGI